MPATVLTGSIREGSYSRTTPFVVDCRGWSAVNRVSVIAASDATCPTGGGRDFFSHVNDNRSVTVLCLERQFRRGQCFLAHPPDHQSYTGSLISVIRCKPPKIPHGFNVVVEITAVITSVDRCPPLNTGLHGSEWTVLDGSTKVCAAVRYLT